MKVHTSSPEPLICSKESNLEYSDRPVYSVCMEEPNWGHCDTLNNKENNEGHCAIPCTKELMGGDCGTKQSDSKSDTREPMNEKQPEEEIAEGKDLESEEGKEEDIEGGHLMKGHTTSTEP